KKDRKEEQFAEIPLRPMAIAQNHAPNDAKDNAEHNADDMSPEMVDTLSAKGIADGSGIDIDGEVTGVSPSNLVASVPVKAAPTKAAPANTAQAEPKKEAPKPTTAKTEPPKKAEVKPTTVAKTDKVTADKVAAEKAKAQTAQASKAVPKAAAKDEIKVVSRESLSKPGLTLQLGAFSNAANVKALVAQLRKGGFKAYTIPSTPKDGVLTKVFVGPDISEAKLKKMQADIASLTRLQGRIVPFNPLES
ncbi:MAG: SPOR domain-containing protein, partial [Shewanella sp.]